MSSSKSLFTEGPFVLIETPKFKTGANDQYTKVATEMSLVHNCIMRAFNGIYNQALTVPPSDYKNFVPYAHACFQGLDAHHRGEETHAFVEIEAATGVKGMMEVNVHQHEAFHDGLDEFGAYLESLIKGDLSQLSGTRLRSIMDSFAEPLNQHLHEEILTLLALAEYGDKIDVNHIFEQEAKTVIGSLSKTRVLPAILLNHDRDYEGGIHADFPPIPAPVKWVFLNVFTLWNYGWWKYAACSFSGKLRTVQSTHA